MTILKMLSFWNETLENISQDQRKDKFIFNVNKIMYEVPLSYALGISPLITAKYLKDPTYREMEIQENIEEEFSNFIKGKKIRKETFLKIGKLLNNKEMIQKWRKTKRITNETVIEYLKCLNEIYNSENSNKNQESIIKEEDIKEAIEYIVNHIEEMKEKIKEMREEELILIIRNENIRLEKEDSLWEIIKERIQEMKKRINNHTNNKGNVNKIRQMRRILLENINIKYLNENNLKEYIEEIDEEDISKNVTNDENNGSIWNQIRDIILNNIQNNKTNNIEEEKKSNMKIITHEEGKNFEGIIHYLESQYGKDIHNQGIITVSASSNGHPTTSPQEVINYDSDDCWESDWGVDKSPWLEIDFKKRKIQMNGYSLQSFNRSKASSMYSNHYMKNWTIEGRNKGDQWQKINRQINNQDLNGSTYQHYFSIGKITKPYQYIRIKFGTSYKNNSDVGLSNFEIFGIIHEEES